MVQLLELKNAMMELEMTMMVALLLALLSVETDQSLEMKNVMMVVKNLMMDAPRPAR